MSVNDAFFRKQASGLRRLARESSDAACSALVQLAEEYDALSVSQRSPGRPLLARHGIRLLLARTVQSLQRHPPLWSGAVPAGSITLIPPSLNFCVRVPAMGLNIISLPAQSRTRNPTSCPPRVF